MVCHSDKRGSIIEIDRGRTWEQFNIVTSKKGSIRGNHYHKNTIELLYCLKGKLEIHLVNLKNKKRQKFRILPGEGIIIELYDAHAVQAIEDSSWTILYSKEFDPNDNDLNAFIVMKNAGKSRV